MKPRFEVDTAGMRALQAGREPWQLAKELVANSWDEPTVTRCEITLKSTDVRKALLTCYDNGKGFSKIEDAYILMGHTPKRGQPNVRGRFNIGEKEILSVAISASVQTSGKFIGFPKSGGRYIKDAKVPIQGTKVECVLPWGNRQVENTIAKLKELLPPKGITYTVNGEVVSYRAPSKIIEATLDTVLQDSPTEPIRPTKRKTQIELYDIDKTTTTLDDTGVNYTKLKNDWKLDSGVLYEMGIPIQSLNAPFLVNVLQKVPMPPNRDVVRDSYLQDIYKTILETTIDELPQEQAAETWVRTAIEDKDINPETVKKAMDKRFGDKAVLWSSDPQANERAVESGYEVIHGRTLSEAEREAMSGVGLVHSSDKFKMDFASAEYISESEWSDGMKKVAEYTIRLSTNLLGKPCKVRMYKLPNGSASAEWDNSTKTLHFNVSNLGKKWFDTINENTTGLILHELSHSDGNWHDYIYYKKFQQLAGKAVHLALEKPEIFRL